MLGNKDFALDTSIYFGSLLFEEDIIYNVQNVTLPGINFNHQQLGTKYGTFLNSTADSIEFSDLKISIILDDKFVSWTKIMSIALDMVKVNEQFTLNEATSYILIVDSMGNESIKINFNNCKLINIGDLSYSTVNDNDVLTLDVTIKYDYFEIESLNITENDSLINFNKKVNTIRSDAKEPIDLINTTTTIED